jgi:hypothetical protein
MATSLGGAMPVLVPNVIGLGKVDAEAKLDAAHLRYIARFPFSATGDGSATAQSPAAGTSVPAFSIVTVDYPSILGPLDDSPVDGPTFPAGTYDATVTSVIVGDPFGSGQGAWVEFVTQLDGGPVPVRGTLYFDHGASPGAPPDRIESMRRGAMLGAAQRAFTHQHPVRLVTGGDMSIRSIELRRP